MIQVSGVQKTAGGKILFSDASFQVYEGEKVGLVGSNGAGKTTFFRLLVGEEQPEQGTIVVPKEESLAYFSQKVGEMKGRSALEEVMSGNSRIVELEKRLRKIEQELSDSNLDPDQMNSLLEEMGEVQSEFEKKGGYEIENDAKYILTGLGIDPKDHDKEISLFSGGWKMRIALAKVLLQKPDYILMDEPTNYLDMETILWLEQWLANYQGAVLMTTHDREFMNRTVSKIVEIARKTTTTYSGNYDFYETEKAIRKRNNEAEFSRQQSMLKKEQDFIDRFKARASHAAQVQSRVKMLEKIERVELEPEEEVISIQLPEIPRGGNDVAVIKELSKGWQQADGSFVTVFSSLNAVVLRQDRIAVTGVNGAGKSTFLKVLCQIESPTTGEVVLGPSIQTGYFGQITMEQLNGDLTVFETLREKLPHQTDAFIRKLLASFLFKGDEIDKKVKVLSGGEKARVILSFLLSLPYNLLVLDEPTNHLDIRSREVLLDALKRYQGTLLFVSHDRYFLKAIAQRVFEVDKGKIQIYEGDYSYYLSKKKEILAK